MLAPDARILAVELLRPPTGYRLDRAVITTYTLDLEALLALPLGVLAHADADLETLLADQLLLLEALQETSGRLHVFVDESGIAVPRTQRELYALLEEGVHPVRAPGGGVFHPKVWVARFTAEGEQCPVLRVGVMSRNLTFDRSWDVALVSEAEPKRRQRAKPSAQLGDFLRRLPTLAVQPLPDEVRRGLDELGAEVGRTRFPAPDGFDDPITWRVIGLDGPMRRPWFSAGAGSRVLAVSPFLSSSALDALAGMGTRERLLVSRQEALAQMPEETLEAWRMNEENEVLAFRDADLEEAEDGGKPGLSGLHAKIIAVERARQVDWHIGSANLTDSASIGRNIETMAVITGSRGSPASDRGSGIEQFLNAGFRRLCIAHERVADDDSGVEDDDLAAARARLAEAQHALLAIPLVLVCKPADGGMSCVLQGKVDLPAEVEAVTWPISIPEKQARSLKERPQWSLPITRVSAFLAFRLHVAHGDVADVRFTRKLTVEGMPEGRLNDVLRTIIDSPERFLQLLRALLGGLDGMVDWAGKGAAEGGTSRATGFRAETLLEDLMRTASREPARLKSVRRLIEQMTDKGEGQGVVPEEIREIWNAVDNAMKERRR